MLSAFCVKRPVFAIVLSLVIVIAGLVAMFNLPIAQYPELTPPQVTVTATYPGADSQTVADTVAAPIETQVNGVDNMIYMQSTSSPTGQMSLNVYFDTGTDPDIAQVQVQNRVSLALAQLPQSVQQNGVNVQKRSSSFLMLIAVYSPDGRYDQQYVGNYANLYVLDALKRVPGANQAQIMGDADLAMRIWLKPDRMAALGITTTDVQNAVASYNQQYGAGSIGQAPSSRGTVLSFPIVTPGRLAKPADFDNIIVRAASQNAAVVRIRDIGRAEVGQNSYALRSSLDGKPATIIAVYQQPGSNALQVAKGVRDVLAKMQPTLPQGIATKVSLDTTQFVKASIDEVVHTLIEAVILVILVVFVFLQSWRTTVIPVVAVFVSVIGTFAGLLALGFSINLLTLFALVLAIGIVVDDAIVVVENVERNMHQFNLSPREATLRAMEEVTGPVIAIVLVLSAVFIPVAFVSGTTGMLYKQFALTLVVSVVISGFVALTLSPALAAMILKPTHGKPWRVFAWFNTKFDNLTTRYTSGVRAVMRRATLSVLLCCAMLVAVWGLFEHIPSSFVPKEDQGYALAAAFLPDSASLDRTQKTTEQVADMFRKHPAVEDSSALSGYSFIDGQYKTNAGTVFIALKDFKERSGSLKLSILGVMRSLVPQLREIQEAVVVPVAPPSIPGLGTQGGFEFWVQNRTDGTAAQLEATTRAFIAAASKRPELASLMTTIKSTSRQLRVEADNDKAAALGVPISNVYGALQTLFGSLYVSQYTLDSRVWQVILQAEPQYRDRVQDLQNVYVRQSDNKMVPIAGLVKTSYISGPDLETRFNGFPAAKITGDAAPGYSSGQAIAAMEEVAHATLPPGYAFAWSGEAYQEQKSGNTTVAVFAFGIIIVFLILAAQYESWSLPLSILTAVPFGIFGALIAIWLRGLDNDVYFQIGLVTLVGLAAKNAILIVEFAVEKRKEGMSSIEAAVEAARLRLRPIVMTSLAFILGAIPLAIAFGAGANSRHSIGTGIIGGMIAATSLALLFVPMFFHLITSLSERLGGKRGKSGDKPVGPEDAHGKQPGTLTGEGDAR
ncbi:efflux RND transporter permease subunit [Paraburkholderia haematera]|uniref:Efflux pump membrane transporter n=1 Tax=Paraburkholderia haematera TaxID=2793077 RepID=A0ABN7MEC2_9BURK|nr:multidrug efflux RND transporter permease subunit [Paraburkholderia haematera]CAE6801666.1 Efflux pump membrane transporter BepE [Paraburkholderia haematera]